MSRPRKALGRIHGLAVRFGEPATGTLLVGEGIETVLSLVTAMPGHRRRPPHSPPAASAHSRRLPASRAWSSHATTTRTAERAAERLVRRCASARVATLVVAPEGDDFNDDLVALGSQALAARLAPMLRLPGRAGE